METMGSLKGTPNNPQTQDVDKTLRPAAQKVGSNHSLATLVGSPNFSGTLLDVFQTVFNDDLSMPPVLRLQMCVGDIEPRTHRVLLLLRNVPRLTSSGDGRGLNLPLKQESSRHPLEETCNPSASRTVQFLIHPAVLLPLVGSTQD
eukprot:6455107-Amphidinium_carterae.5